MGLLKLIHYTCIYVIIITIFNYSSKMDGGWELVTIGRFLLLVTGVGVGNMHHSSIFLN